jgi:hypothetical protein
MQSDQKQDPLLEYGHEMATALFVVSLVIGIAMVFYDAFTNGVSGVRILPAVIVAGIGSAAAWGILILRKRRERALRPSWMGTTTQWQNKMKERVAPPSDGTPPTPPSTERRGQDA